MTTTKFGFRQWGSHGDLRCEYWISDIDLAGGKETPPTHPGGELKFTTGSLAAIHNYRPNRPSSSRVQRKQRYDDIYATTPRSQSHSHGYYSSNNNHTRHLNVGSDSDTDPDLICRVRTAGASQQGWRAIFSTKRPRAQPSISSVRSTSSPSDISTSSMSTDVKTRLPLPHAMPPTPPTSDTSSKRRSGFLGRLKAHHRRESSDVTPSSRPEPARRATPSSPATSTSQTRPETPRPPTANGTVTSNDDAPPQIVIRSPTQRDEFEGVHYPDGLEPSPTPRSPSARSNRGIKWAENYDDAPPRPRRTSSAATHGRRSSIYSKDVDGNFDNMLGVDAGVGSKARRLSVALPDDLQVDECSLEEHFSVLQRMKHKEIGAGGAAVVKLMQSKTAGEAKDRVFAVKEFRLREPQEETEFEYERKIKSEFAISKACDHENIVKTFRLCHSGDQWYHVMEYCELGDLNDLIKSGIFAGQEDRNCMFKQLVRGVDYLHSRGIAHRDLKSENLLVNKQGCLKIADFGTGEVFCGQHPGVRNCRRQSIVDPNEPIRYCPPGWVGSVPYMAPEIYQRLGKYDPRAVDVWAVAIVYVTLCFQGNCWDFAGMDCKNFRIFMQHWDAWFEDYPDHIIKDGRRVPQFGYIGRFMRLDDNETRTMLMGMLHPEPSKRWKISDVLNSKPVENAACCQQSGYSDDIRKRQKKSLHNHIPADKRKKLKV